MTPKIILEDDKLLVIDKPAGWIVNEVKTTKGQPVIQTWLFNNFDYPIAKDKSVRSGVVHRLDKETSGVLIIAKTKKAFDNLQRQFKKRVIGKEYKALVHGRIEFEKGTVNVPIGRLPWNRKRFGVVPGGRSSKTRYEIDRNYKKEKQDFTLVTLFPKTGRTHQIRVHLKYMKHPVVADELYAGRKTARNDRRWCPRLFLHAVKIGFNHPKTKRRVNVESALPKDLKKALEKLS